MALRMGYCFQRVYFVVFPYLQVREMALRMGYSWKKMKRDSFH